MKNKVLSRKNIIQFIKFGIVGLSNTAIGLGTYYFFLWIGLHYMLANVLSWFISVFNAFYWNSKYVFKSTELWIKALCKTYISYGVSFLVGAFLLYIFVEFIKISECIAPFFVLLVTIPVNFILNKFWTFK